MQYREVVHWQLRSLNRPASSLGPSPDAAKPHERPNEYSRTNRDAQAGARPEAQWQCNGNGIDNSPPLSPLVAHESMCLLACTATVRADITPAGMWPSHKQDLSPAPAADWGCVSTSRLGMLMPLRPTTNDVLLLFCGEPSPSPRLGGKKRQSTVPLSPGFSLSVAPWAVFFSLLEPVAPLLFARHGNTNTSSAWGTSFGFLDEKLSDFGPWQWLLNFPLVL
ncbi:hypothetical protein N5P37_003883 [Trichoderma harzianum]|uniref:Uncharacterized protein n=1 Tax=Trichoderma harzianum CBS 226.95 TaxID=983964 RepID=A0A2T4AVV6_TRIHA|nr:hypothetical protein M431DRAFT_205751 [Trichoderma harzianum CBS 226.95]KAK0764481.1 hypothetical protein N5P37_003883 [Trichoderma harzianum]PTB61202.1 hypothetical protein M431DRAFT_205751 [Trichoderma harzianum CBS 226.95]